MVAKLPQGIALHTQMPSKNLGGGLGTLYSGLFAPSYALQGISFQCEIWKKGFQMPLLPKDPLYKRDLACYLCEDISSC